MSTDTQDTKTGTKSRCWFYLEDVSANLESHSFLKAKEQDN